MFLSHKYINSNDGLYVYIEISIWNRNTEKIFVLKNYDINNIVEEDDGIILHLSSWIDKLDFLKYSSAMYHNPPMIEIRNKQKVYLSILLKIPDKNGDIDKSKNIKEIIGLKYSLQEYITEDISWAENIDEFANGIKENVDNLIFVYNQYNNKYGNVWVSPLEPPEWAMGTWVVDGEEISNNSRIIFRKNDIIFFHLSLNEYFLMSIYKSMKQNIYDNNYEIILEGENDEVNLIKFKFEEGHLLIEDKINNEIVSYKLNKL
jgi:hypothetical protein